MNHVWYVYLQVIPIDSSSDDEISFKITAEERERVLSPEEWPPSPVDNTEPQEEEEGVQEVEQQVCRWILHNKTCYYSGTK